MWLARDWVCELWNPQCAPQCQYLAEKSGFQESEPHLDLMFKLGGLVQAGTLLMLHSPSYRG